MKIINFIKEFKEYKKRAISAEEKIKQMDLITKQYDMIKNERETLKNKILDQEKVITKKANKINDLKTELSDLNLSINDYKYLIKQLRGTKGGLTAENNKLKENIKDLTKKLEIAMDEKYMIKKLPPARPRKGQAIRIKNSIRQSNIAKNMFKDVDEVSDENN